MLYPATLLDVCTQVLGATDVAALQVLRAVADGLAACLLDRSDGNKTMLRAVSRELLAAAVLRNVMFYFTPYTVNKVRGIDKSVIRRSVSVHLVSAHRSE